MITARQSAQQIGLLRIAAHPIAAIIRSVRRAGPASYAESGERRGDAGTRRKSSHSSAVSFLRRVTASPCRRVGLSFRCVVSLFELGRGELLQAFPEHGEAAIIARAQDAKDDQLVRA